MSIKNCLEGLVTILLFCITNIGQAQENGVEKSIWGIQGGVGEGNDGILGVGIYNEAKLGSSFVLRSEFGIKGRRFTPENAISFKDRDFVISPGFSVSPRWYFNLTGRQNKSRNTTGNAADYISIKLIYNPDWFSFPATGSRSFSNQLSLVPMIGLKRNIYKGLIFQVEGGYGYQFNLDHLNDPVSSKFDVILVYLKLGYQF
jgi:hypothetical protein